MISDQQPAKPTSKSTLWLLGIAGGVILAVVMFIAGGEDADETRRLATGTGTWAIRLLVMAVIVGGGWSAIRSKAK